MSPLERPPPSQPSMEQSHRGKDGPALLCRGRVRVGGSSSPQSPAPPSPLQLLPLSDGRFLSLLSDADFLMLNDGLYVQATYIAGEEVWRQAASGL